MSLPQERPRINSLNLEASTNLYDQALPSSGRLALVTSCTGKHTRATVTRTKTNIAICALLTRTITKGK